MCFRFASLAFISDVRTDRPKAVILVAGVILESSVAYCLTNVSLSTFVDTVTPRTSVNTVKPCCSAPAFNVIPPIELTIFGPKRYFHSHSYIGNNGNLGTGHNVDQSFEICYGGVYLNGYFLSQRI